VLAVDSHFIVLNGPGALRYMHNWARDPDGAPSGRRVRAARGLWMLLWLELAGRGQTFLRVPADLRDWED